MISFKIYSGETLPRAKWDVLAEKSLFALPEFVACWQSRNLRPIFFAIEDNNRILAGMAGVRSGGRFLPRFESTIDGLDGGVVTLDNDESPAVRLYENVLEYFRRQHFFRASIHNPTWGISLPGFKKSTRLTHIIDLTDAGAGDDRKVGEHVRTGQRRGATVTVFDNPKWLNEFYALVVLTARRHGTKPRYNQVVFERLYELSRVDNRIVWLAVLYEGRLIASRISFIEKTRIINWQSFSDKEYGYLKANYLMMDHIIGRARSSGIGEVDLGRSPDNAEGLIDFKKRWGGREAVVPSYTYYSAPGTWYYRWKNR
jgi:hypothetical protein